MFALDDLDVLFDADLPNHVTVTLPGGEVVAGMFRNDFAEDFGMAGTRPAVLMASEWGIGLKDRLSLRGKTYVVCEIRPWRVTGISHVLLSEAD